MIIKNVKRAVGSTDGVVLIVTGKMFAICHDKMFAICHDKIWQFMEHAGGALEWSCMHNTG